MEEKEMRTDRLVENLGKMRQRIAELEQAEFKVKHLEQMLKEHEERFRALTEQSVAGITIIKDGRFIFANQMVAKILGYSVEEILGWKSLEFLNHVHPDDRSFVTEQVKKKQLGEGGVVPSYNLRFINNDGETKWLYLHSKTIHFDGSDAIEAMVLDVTDQKRMEKELTDSEKKYNDLIEKAQEGIWAIDDGLNTTFVNPRMLDILGYSVDEMIGKSLFSFMDEHGVKIATHYWERRKQGIKEEHDFEFLHKNGERVYTRLETSPTTDNSGNFAGALAFVTDITQRKHAEKELSESEKRYRTITENLNIGIYRITPGKEREFLEVNPAFVRLFGYEKKEDIMKLKVKDLCRYPKGGENIKTAIGRKRFLKDAIFKFKKRNGETFWGSITAATFYDEKGKVKYCEGIIEDVTERKKAEEDKKERLMRFKVEEGKVYLIKEDSPTLALEVFADLLKVGYSGTIISRTPAEEYKMRTNLDCEFLWLAMNSKEDALLPNLQEINKKIEDFPARSAILIDRLDYLFFKNGFKRTLSFVQDLREFSYLFEHIIILSLDPSVLSEKEVILLEKETEKLEAHPRLTIPKKMTEILRAIYEYNIVGESPSYTVIGDGLGVSRPTIRKRIQKLISLGYVSEVMRGRRKYVELTESGRSLRFS